jgi:Fe-S-cluster containining protein
MDRAYDAVAGYYGFNCEGCEDNCCKQRFYHYTLVEYYYLLEGVKKAEPELVRTILTRAKIVTETYFKELQIGEILPLMCPVNSDGRCTLYEYRPMICRLHGLPHKFLKPDGAVQEGGGCHRFELLHKAAVRLDRTVAYTELAQLEKELRAELGFKGRYKKTTAEMLMDMVEHLNLNFD